MWLQNPPLVLSWVELFCWMYTVFPLPLDDSSLIKGEINNYNLDNKQKQTRDDDYSVIISTLL